MDTLAYTLLCSNLGPDPAANVVVTDLAQKRQDLMIEGLLGIGDELAALEKLRANFKLGTVLLLPIGFVILFVIVLIMLV